MSGIIMTALQACDFFFNFRAQLFMPKLYVLKVFVSSRIQRQEIIQIKKTLSSYFLVSKIQEEGLQFL
jgi:hypothetical protein